MKSHPSVESDSSLKTDRRIVGFVGLGNMGEPLSINLLKAGFDVSGFDPNGNPNFSSAGGKLVSSITSLANLPIIVLSLPNASALKETVDVLIAARTGGQIIVDLSSNPLNAKLAQANRLAEVGVTLLDCEVSGLPIQAVDRKAVIFQSGDIESVNQVRPVFDALAEQCFYLGSFGAATKMKLIANTMVCVHNLMAAEALNLAVRAGLSADLVVATIKNSAAGSTTFSNKTPLMLTRAFEKGKGPFRHMFGYLARSTEMATQAGAQTPLLDAARLIYSKAETQGRHDEDIAAIIEILESNGRGRDDE